ncbi:MAG: sulfatase-like hydrolase/transferase [Planctomycetes bacterium]|nr:sulfatase-like hydrolase/transferase [Planctomycetota bacterium]
MTPVLLAVITQFSQWPVITELKAESGIRPNIVFIMADDMGYGDLGCYNKKSKVPTPNMDRLAGQGMRFLDAHSPSAVCTPTRYGVLTGRYAWRTRLKSGVLWGFSTSLIEKDRTTVASLLKANGYHTGAFGKWHLGFQTHDPSKTEREQKVDYAQPLRPGPLTVGFDDFFGIPASLDMEPYVFVENDKPLQQPTELTAKSEQVRRGGKGFWRAGPIAPGFKHIDVLPKITEKAVGFIDRRANAAKNGKPFFLYFPLSAPHTPWLPTKEFQGKSGAGAYGDFTTQVDWSVGQVLDALERHKLSDNTLVILTSDNGAHWTPGDIEKFGHRANRHWRGQKADAWEGGHRVPYLVRWPGVVKPGSISDETICHTDLLATCADVVGASLPPNAGEDSYSILPVLRGEKLNKPLREATVHHSINGTFAIRQGNMKLILGLGSGGFSNPRTIKPKPNGPKGQLYNLSDDPSEKINLYQKHPEIVQHLTALLERYKQSGSSARRLESTSVSP